MLAYTDSEVRKFHPICGRALNEALVALGKASEYEVKHHEYTGTLEMDFAVKNRSTGKYLCVIEVKRTPSDVQSTRYQFQAMSYVQMNMPLNEKTYYIITNLEKLISFRYDASTPRVYQQMLNPGLEDVCDFTIDHESAIQSKLAYAFQILLSNFIDDKYTLMTTLDDFLTCVEPALVNKKQWKSRLAILMYEYLRGSFQAIKKTEPTISYNVASFGGNLQQICNEANRVDFNGIFSYNTTDFLTNLTLNNHLLAEIYDYGHTNISGDAIADALHGIISEDKRHEGEVATDPELANLVSSLAKIYHGDISSAEKVCDPAAGSGNLIGSAIKTYGLRPHQVIANDINPKLVELLSLRLGLCFPSVIRPTNAPYVTTKDVTNMNRSDFIDVKVVLLNPPFVAGINCVNRKVPFFNKIHALTGTKAITEVGQQNLGAVFLELICRLLESGTTIACIFPKAQLLEQGQEAIAFRKMILNVFGLKAIFSYPGTGLFKSVTEETCILVGEIGTKSNLVQIYSSEVNVADIDLHALLSFSGEYDNTGFVNITSDVEAREIRRVDLNSSTTGGWRIINSEMAESISFVEAHIIRNAKLLLAKDSTSNYRRGPVGGSGGSDLLFFDSIEDLYNKYRGYVVLDEGMRNAKSDDFILKSGDSKFLNFNKISDVLADNIIKEYITQTRPAGQQQRQTKSVTEWKKIAKRNSKIISPANSVLLPTKTRKTGRVHISTIPLHVSTNFVAFSYPDLETAIIIASYMATVFYQLECEVASKDHAGVRKSEKINAETTHVPNAALLYKEERERIINEAPNVQFQDLNNPRKTDIDRIWAKILFGDDADAQLDEAIRLLGFLANRRNPI